VIREDFLNRLSSSTNDTWDSEVLSGQLPKKDPS
jgi:hypothetical protein